MAASATQIKPYRLAPGHILQFSYLKERLKLRSNLKNFIEIGAGQGLVSRILLNADLVGVGFDLNPSACEINREMNSGYLLSGKYQIFESDFFNFKSEQKYDLIISCMVLEHFNESQQKAYFEKCKELLSSNGVIVTLVPSSPNHWGIEDEIAGHLRRYQEVDFENLAQFHHLRKTHCVGLTFPLSNFLLPISNFIVKRNESKQLNLSQKDKTIHSGNRKVKFKTEFPFFFRLLINEWILMPFLLLQRVFLRNKNSLVLYCEMERSSN